MRFNLVLFLIILSSQILFAGTFKIVVHDSTMEDVVGKSYNFKAHLVNLTDDAVVINIARVSNSLPENWTTSMCFGETCYSPFTDEITEALAAGDSAEFKLTFNTDAEIPGEGQSLIRFRDIISGDKDSVLMKLTTTPAPLFEIKQKDLLTTIKPGQTYDMTSQLVNLTDQLLNVVITRTVNDIPEDWSTSICIGLACYAPTLSVVNEVIPPNDSLELKMTYTTGLMPDSGIVHVTVEEPIGGQTEEIVYHLQTKSQFQVFPHDTVGSGPTNTDIELGGYVHNFTDSTIQIEMIRQTNEIPADWTTSLCFGDICLAPHIDSIIDSIPANDSLWFSIHFYSGDAEAEAQALLALTVPGSNDTISQRFKVTSNATAIEDDIRTNPESFRLLGNFPNPFNISTTVRFESPEAIRKGKFEVYDINGALVFSSTLDGFTTGTMQFNFNGIGKQGHELTSGIYFYRLSLVGQSGKYYAGIQKFTLLK